MTTLTVNKMIPLFLNFLAALSPSVWVIIAGCAGVGVGAFGRWHFAEKARAGVLKLSPKKKRAPGRKPRITRLK